MALAKHERSAQPPVLVALIALFLVLLLVIVVGAEKRKINGSAVTIAIGATVGLLVWPTGLADKCNLDNSLAIFNRELFYYTLLPPVIFEAGFSLRKRPFFSNIGTILLFAVLGTLLTVIAIAQPLYAVGRTGIFRHGTTGADVLDFRTPLDSYLFSACVSATDPVATLSIMGSMGVEEQLYAIVFGESVLNDAVAIVLVNILESLGEEGFTHPAHFMVGIGWFILISLGSIATATVVSGLSALLLKWMHKDLAHHASYEVGLIYLFGYISYAFAEAIGCSGLLAIFISGVLESHYHVYSLSDSGRVATAIALKSIAHLFETGLAAPFDDPVPAQPRTRSPTCLAHADEASACAAIFAYVGVEIFTRASPGESSVPEASNDTAPLSAPHTVPWCENLAAAEAGGCVPGVVGGVHAAGFVAFCVLLVVLSRVVVVPPLVLMANLTRSKRARLSPATTVALIAAGLRGAIAFALSKSIRSLHAVNMTAGAVGTVVFTVFVIGGSTRALLTKLGLAKDNNMREVIKQRDDEMREEADRRRDASLAGACDGHNDAGQHVHAHGTRGMIKRIIHRLRHLDADYLRPMLIASKEQSDAGYSPDAEGDEPETGVQLKRLDDHKHAHGSDAAKPFAAPATSPTSAIYMQSIVASSGSSPKGSRL